MKTTWNIGPSPVYEQHNKASLYKVRVHTQVVAVFTFYGSGGLGTLY